MYLQNTEQVLIGFVTAVSCKCTGVPPVGVSMKNS